MPPALSERVPPVLRERDFLALWTSRAVAFTGASMTFMVLPLALYDMTRSTVALGVSLAAQAIAVVLLSPIAGSLADRWNRRNLIMGADLVRAVVLCGLLFANAVSQLWIVYLCAMLAAAAATVMRTAHSSITPQLVDPEHVHQANALNTLVATASSGVSPVAGVALYAAAGLDGVVLVTVLSLFVSVLLTCLLRDTETPPCSRQGAKAPAAAMLRAVRNDLAGGAAHVRGNGLLRTMMVGSSLSGLGNGALVLALLPFLRDGMNLSQHTYGMALTVMSVAGVGANLLLAGRLSNANPLTLYTRGLPWAGPLLLAMAVAVGEPMVAIALLALYGAVSVVPAVAYTTVVAQQTPRALHGRVLGVGDLVSHLFLLVGAGASGLAAESFGPVAALAVAGLAYVTWGCVGLLMMRRHAGVRISRLRPAAPAVS